MNLPFTESEFLDVFGAYNRALWPALLVIWMVTAAVVARWWSKGECGRELAVLSAAHWLWSGVAYHWLFFRVINPAATVFAALFVAQGLLLAWIAVTARGRFIVRYSVRNVIAQVLVGYALMYPMFGILLGLEYPRLPLFAVPCPTTLLTAGLLMTASGLPRFVSLVPALWAVIGASAAFVLHVRADLALVAAFGLLAFNVLLPNPPDGRNGTE